MKGSVKRIKDIPRWALGAAGLTLALLLTLAFRGEPAKAVRQTSANPGSEIEAPAAAPSLQKPAQPPAEKQDDEDTTGSRRPSTLKPPALRKGDTIGIIAPASSMDDSLVRRAVRNISRRGYEVKLSTGYLKRRGYLAADDKTRAAELNTFFLDKSVKAILCLRGGYGSPRILDRLDYDGIRKNPKIFIGYSDITALLNGIHAKTGLVSFHGPMAKEFSIGDGLTPYSEKYFWPVFTPESRLFTDWGGSGPRGRGQLKTIAGGVAEGVLVGGNLSVLTCTIGTPYEARSDNCILFLEDVSEKPFRIDRMLNQLRLSGMLGKYKGVILGSFTGCLPLRGSGIGLLDVFDHYFEELGVPVLSGYAAGHQPDQATLPIGARVRLDASAKKVSIIEAPVASTP